MEHFTSFPNKTNDDGNYAGYGSVAVDYATPTAVAVAEGEGRKGPPPRDIPRTTTDDDRRHSERHELNSGEDRAPDQR